MKLIDWATCPIGVATDYGRIVHVQNNGFDADFYFSGSDGLNYLNANSGEWSTTTSNGFDEPVEYPPALLSASHQPWLVYEEGVTVVPEWAVVEYRGNYKWSDGEVITDETKHIGELRDVFLYRITDIKEGWTENPSEVTE